MSFYKKYAMVADLRRNEPYGPKEQGYIDGFNAALETVDKSCLQTKDTMQNIDILGQLERLAASFPWDSVDLWVKREPEGSLDFTAYVRENPKLGFKMIFGCGNTAEKAVDDAIKTAEQQPNKRDPEACRQAKIKELQEQVAKLMSVEIGLPPYVPNRELAQYAGKVVDV